MVAHTTARELIQKFQEQDLQQLLHLEEDMVEDMVQVLQDKHQELAVETADLEEAVEQ